MLLVQRRKPDWHPDRRLHGLVRVLVRFFLCEMLLGYGFAKVFPLQFAQPSSFRLAQQLGDMSPMGLLWTFMGYSPSYQMFTGAVEVLAGLLLTTRRTTLLGALVALAAMTHVFALNMCFDVPVKLYSFNYLMMAIFWSLRNSRGSSACWCWARQPQPGHSRPCSATSSSIDWPWCCGRSSWSRWSMARSAGATSAGATCMAALRRRGWPLGARLDAG